MRGPVPAPEMAQISASIRVARVLCIVGLVYVHAWTGLDGGALNAANQTVQRLFQLGLIEAFSRSSVPLLSIISGYLVAFSLRKPDISGFLPSKARSILLPMIMWNMIAILLVSGSAWLFALPAPVPPNLWWLVEEILVLTRPNHINVQMSFLRDLFLCMVAAPLLVRCDSRLLVLGVVLVLMWLMTGWPSVVLLRPSILVCFILGILANRHRLAARAATAAAGPVVIGYVGLVAIKLWLWYKGGVPVGARSFTGDDLDLPLRFVGALFFWKLAWALAESRWASVFTRLEPYMFLMFCSHLVMLWLGAPLIGKLTGPMGSAYYPFFLVLQPVLILLATLGLARLLRLLPTAVGDLLSGSRLPRPGLSAA